MKEDKFVLVHIQNWFVVEGSDILHDRVWKIPSPDNLSLTPAQDVNDSKLLGDVN